MAERDPGPGDVLAGRYEIRGELGRGGMATVYRGLDRRLQRPVAIKVFRGGFAEAVDPQRTTQEMRLLAAVNHPSVVAVLDASNGDGVFGAFLVMELVVGADLGALLHRARGPLAADFARRIVADVAGALAALHAQGVVHRDVKPANILVPEAANSSSLVAAKLTDFGIAQLVDGARLTGPDSILGTAAYLSPEQVRGAAPRPASDVYSLGLVLLEALTGRRAFPGAAAEAAMARLQRPPALPEDASPALAELLSRMTALDPAHRPGAADVASALREQLVGRVTAPDAAQTAPTPIAGVAAAVPPVPHPDATAPQEPFFTPGRGMPVSGRIATTTTATAAPKERRRFPTVLAVAATVLAASVAGVAISAASNLNTTKAQTSDVAQDAPSKAVAPVKRPSAAPDEDVRYDAPRPVATRSSTPTPTPTPTTPTPTPTATATAAPTTPAPSTSAPAAPAPSTAPSSPAAPDPAPSAPVEAPSAPADSPAPTGPDQQLVSVPGL
ncbi:serine/threonine-protein kinase [Amnibacterium soli]|uniref:serine/threonine-protein kinase n=1 Tax=Amnibacterium soli TaxID=1282736 RepID=UPI0031EB0179